MNEAQISDKARLLSRLREQLLNVATSQAENNKNQALRILFKRMERMSDDMVFKTLRKLSEIGAVDITAATETLAPAGRTPMDSIQQVLGLLRGGSPPRPTSNPVKDTGYVLEALEHFARYFRDKALHQIERGREDG
jgi:hypothetical protein